MESRGRKKGRQKRRIGTDGKCNQTTRGLARLVKL
jgi:hypothetical protein